MRSIIRGRSTARLASALLVVGGLLSLSGCGKSESEREYNVITGTALGIDEATGKVAMNFFNKKKQIEMKVEGTVVPQTEILINGRVAELNEIKIGDQVVVTGYKEGEGSRRRLVATKIEVMTGEGWAGGPGSTTKATSKPAGKTATKAASK